MEEKMLSKSQKVLERRTVWPEGDVVFAQDEGVAEVWLSAEDDADFGHPQTITVTVEPGDKLNG